jgi:hypothetical protein
VRLESIDGMRHGARMMRLRICLLLALCAACARPFEERVGARLEAAGIPAPMAQCMAGRWVDRLSLLQLRKIEQLSGELKARSGQDRLTVLDVVAEMQKLDDPEIIRVTSTSAAVCALRL